MKPVKGYRYVKWPCQRLAAQLLLYKTALNGPAPCVPSPSSGLWGWGHPIYIFLIFPGHLEFWTPLQIPSWGPPLGCTLLHICIYSYVCDIVSTHEVIEMTVKWFSSYKALKRSAWQLAKNTINIFHFYSYLPYLTCLFRPSQLCSCGTLIQK